ncbi:alpha/beta fold hydrolase [Dyadobacter sp. Leaf189]|uniref:alpha/beta fold hydrolase n=1 Tax=Dyadobacter sp. Leaf189 TaxID=1736295 RepID=UPI0006FABAE6|nr:alpha/beta fold hydrolase [Dyadobacter sp. Leaf189]KQS34225.1 alpha/beta hydrolase [Dyadobacter sp. Leaf189]
MSNYIAQNLPCHKLGQGPRILLAFHGIGQDGLSCFKPVEHLLGKHYTIYAFDLFFHASNANSKVDIISKPFWKELLSDFLIKNNIVDFDVMGFSMGGRFALATLEAFADRIGNVYLIAPDGVSENPLYSIATRNAFGRSLFRQVMQKPAFFFKTILILEKLNLVNSSLVRFTQHVLNTPEKRSAILRSWIAFKNLRFDIPQIGRLAKAHNARIFLFTGEFDKLLKPHTVSKLARLLPANQTIRLKSGHSQLVAHSAAWICTLFE